MSEYQYYEFQAIDRPLDEADRQALRAISTRARITATSFTNSYEWGDFKGDPAKLMEHWFDLHLYLANWGSRRLMIRLPKRLVDRSLLDRFLGEVDCVTIRVASENLILNVARDEIEFEDWDDGAGRLAALAPLRADVLAGDLRLFYLLWLTAVEADVFEPDEPEPMPGIGPMNASLAAFTDFFGIDPDLVAAAAERSAVAIPDTASRSVVQRSFPRSMIARRMQCSRGCSTATRMSRLNCGPRCGTTWRARMALRQPPSEQSANFVPVLMRSHSPASMRKPKSSRPSENNRSRRPKKAGGRGSMRSRDEAKAFGAKSRLKSNARTRPPTTRRRAFSMISGRSPRNAAQPRISPAASKRSRNGMPEKGR
ncbi:MAG TPA: hypothetical protein VG271_02670 [Beijerinckiaceae bacterium]|nr:hypothetical protein [Beijerinckiaceae bacterium]